MKKVSPDTMTTEQLITRYVEIGLAQYDAEDHISRYNRLMKQMDKVVNELKSRQGDQRHALLPLHQHPNAQVRLTSAYDTMAFAPEQSKAVFEDLVKKREFPQALSAGMTLSHWERSVSKAT